MGHLHDKSQVESSVTFALEVQQLSVRYRQVTALLNLNFKLPVGACCGVIGPNGAGKSTLFKCVLGMLPHANGQVLVLDSKYNPKFHRVAYIPQRSTVDWAFPATVLDIVMMALDNQWSFLQNKKFDL